MQYLEGVHPFPTRRVVEGYRVESSSYLVVEVGDSVLVQYWQGPDVWEAGGWCFGRVESTGRQGWLPQHVLVYECVCNARTTMFDGIG